MGAGGGHHTPPGLLAASLASAPTCGCPGEGLSEAPPVSQRTVLAAPLPLTELAGQLPANGSAGACLCRLPLGLGHRCPASGHAGRHEAGPGAHALPGPGTGSHGSRVGVPVSGCVFLALMGKMKSESGMKPGAASFRCLGPKPPQLPKISGWESETHDVGRADTPGFSTGVPWSYPFWGSPALGFPM